MRILFIHQNFPAQFKFLAPALARDSSNEVVGLSMNPGVPKEWANIRIVPFGVKRGSTANIHPWVLDFETKVIRGEACFYACVELKKSGFEPDLVIAHPGWGESLFVKEVWPNTKLAIYCEFFYHPDGADFNFDPEFLRQEPGEACRLRLKNANNLLHFDLADAAISPTHWQASTFPEPFRRKITVIHDGIDTKMIAPNSSGQMQLNDTLNLNKEDEIITFVNRNLEPYRGYHVFMRALPEILQRRPKAHVMLVGGDDVSYGPRPEDGRKWKDIFYEEVMPKLTDEQRARIHFLGHIPHQHFISLLQLSTVHVYLTYPFVLSWSLLEAMSAGCTIVASDTSPLHEAIIHNQTGRLVNFFDAQALASNIVELLEQPELRAQLGANARAFAQTHYDLERVCLPQQIAWVEAIVKNTG